MTDKPKKKKKQIAWDAVKLPATPGRIVDSRSGESKFYGRGRSKDTPLEKFESYEDQKKMRELYKQWKDKPKGLSHE
jgi:hypothetical protein